MRDRHAFRPRVNDSRLEDRLVLSNSPVPSTIANAYVQQFHTQFDSISTGVANAVDTTLLGGNNSTPTTATRSAYDAAVLTLVDQADTTLDNILSLSPLAQTQFTAQVDDLLVGTGSNSIISELNAVPTPTSTGAQVTQFTTDAKNLISAAEKSALGDLGVFFSANNPLRAQIGTNGGTPLSVQQSYNDRFNQSFTTFSTSFTSDVTTILLSGSSASTIPTNRPAFDTQVQNDASTLNSALSDTLSLFPNATKGLTSSIDQRLISGTNGMLDQLNALASPTELNGTSAQSFQTQAKAIINSAQTDVLTMVNKTFQGLN